MGHGWWLHLVSIVAMPRRSYSAARLPAGCWLTAYFILVLSEVFRQSQYEKSLPTFPRSFSLICTIVVVLFATKPPDGNSHVQARQGDPVQTAA